ncbi:tRNA U34 5-methylaminomethyl-2-thiouridine-forming methyltransferase MnmC [Flavobacterium croceum DSM 17960]|uniref:tRNA U34 5-methylaminomethyl-2-thiouridine-forming methyltransferase MnmC n=1 Tax=Flavobacterium croceum DSM 17960 TaxID=1121886 RepID=A0A2S4N8N5_9FLAO|nr:tRNA (5-methylaminomethyl-2-thiouridine)(34)-methyltransferase MnmD [Flavobacterium croceum]POS02059.1 tRNA U34 5-methylaminomethyl-2-thiouridine-forming methyltransferase MnmC [Flavobacterium croceum DSM 17960]
MKKEILITKDGSSTLFVPELNETYHSKNGAIQEAYHVFINAGLNYYNQQKAHILEIGFGTGLNAFITYLESENNNKSIHYTAIEAYPVDLEHVKKLNYVEVLEATEKTEKFMLMHTCNWEEEQTISDRFTIKKQCKKFQDILDENLYNIIYFDAFGYDVQPELWSDQIFKQMYKALKTNGILVTYACRGVIKRAMETAGFVIEKLPGAPGKREMLRAIKY